MLCYSHDYYLNDVNNESKTANLENIQLLKKIVGTQHSFEIRKK